jgi:hypothetical protein
VSKRHISDPFVAPEVFPSSLKGKAKEEELKKFKETQSDKSMRFHEWMPKTTQEEITKI